MGVLKKVTAKVSVDGTHGTLCDQKAETHGVPMLCEDSRVPGLCSWHAVGGHLAPLGGRNSETRVTAGEGMGSRPRAGYESGPQKMLCTKGEDESPDKRMQAQTRENEKQNKTKINLIHGA